MKKLLILCGLFACLVMSCLALDNVTNKQDNVAGRKDVNSLSANFDKDFIANLTRAQEEMGKKIIQYESIGKNSVHKKITVSGTHYELGYLIGLIRKQQLGPLKTTDSSEKKLINQQIIDMYGSIYPRHLELLEGVAKALDLTLQDLSMEYMEYMFFTELGWLGFKYPEFRELMNFSKTGEKISEHCSEASYFQANEGRHFVGRNLDLEWERPHFIVTHHLKNTYKSVSNTLYMCFNSTLDGINEKGFFVAEATNGNPPEYNRGEGNNHPGRPAVHSIHLLHILLQTCATVDEAMELIKKVSVWHSTWVSHYFIADASGKSVVVEFDLNNQPVFFVKNGRYQILTNTAYQRGIYFLMNFCGRFRKAIDMLKSPVQNSADMMRLMAAIRSTGISKTLWTTTADLSRPKMDVYFRTENFASPHTFSLEDPGRVNTLTPVTDSTRKIADSIGNTPQPAKITQKKPQDLKPFIGKYSFDKYWSGYITLEDDALYIRNTGTEKFKLTRTGETAFVIPGNGFKVEFVMNDQGAVSGYDFVAHGIRYAGVKVHDRPDYAGDYKSFPRAVYLFIGSLFLLLIIYNIGAFTRNRILSKKGLDETKKKNGKFSGFANVWICITALTGIFGIVKLLYFNNTEVFELYINFGIFRAGLIDVYITWVVLVLFFFSAVFTLSAWLKRYWTLFERVLTTVVILTSIYFFIDLYQMGVFALSV